MTESVNVRKEKGEKWDRQTGIPNKKKRTLGAKNL